MSSSTLETFLKASNDRVHLGWQLNEAEEAVRQAKVVHTAARLALSDIRAENYFGPELGITIEELLIAKDALAEARSERTDAAAKLRSHKSIFPDVLKPSEWPQEDFQAYIMAKEIRKNLTAFELGVQ